MKQLNIYNIDGGKVPKTTKKSIEKDKIFQEAKFHLNSHHIKVLTVDTGVNTGVAIWESGALTSTKLITTRKTFLKEEKISDLYHKFDRLLDKEKPDLVILEGVSFWADSEKSKVSAKTGSLTLLSYIVGLYYAACLKHDVLCYDILFQDWGGQLSAKKVAERVQRKTGFIVDKDKDQHIADAIGMGLSLKGKFGK